MSVTHKDFFFLTLVLLHAPSRGLAAALRVAHESLPVFDQLGPLVHGGLDPTGPSL